MDTAEPGHRAGVGAGGWGGARFKRREKWGIPGGQGREGRPVVLCAGGGEDPVDAVRALFEVLVVSFGHAEHRGYQAWPSPGWRTVRAVVQMAPVEYVQRCLPAL